MSSDVPANTLHKLQVSFPLCQYVQCCSRTALYAGHTLLDLLKDCPWKPSGTGVSQGMPQIAKQSLHHSDLPHRMTRAQEQRRKGHYVEICGWMRPSGEVIVPAATLLSKVRKNKALCCQTCTGSFRQIHPGRLDHAPLCFILSGPLMDTLEQSPLSPLALLHSWVWDALESISGSQTKQYYF